MIKALYEFDGYDEFLNFTEYFHTIGWKIEKQLLKERVNKYYKLKMFQDMENRFYKHKLSIWDLKKEEIITWFDTLVLLRRIISNLLVKYSLKNYSFNVYMEYPLIYGNHMRVDYLIVVKRTIIVFEFGMFNQDEKRSEERYSKKLIESVGYRQVLQNSLERETKVINYVMIYKPEHDRYTKTDLEVNILYNLVEIDKASEFIINAITNEFYLDANIQLNQLEKNRGL